MQEWEGPEQMPGGTMRIGRKLDIEASFRYSGGVNWEKREPHEGERVKAEPEDRPRDDGRHLYVLTSEATGEYLGIAWIRRRLPQQQTA